MWLRSQRAAVVGLSCARARLAGRCMARGLSIGNSPGQGIGQVIVIGGGAIGSLFAGRMACNKELAGRVWLLTAWEDHAAVIQQTKGLIVREEGSAGDSMLMGSVRPASSVQHILDLKAHPQHPIKQGAGSIVIIATKQSGIRRAAEQAAQLLAGLRGGICLTLQNGWGHREIVAAALKYHESKATLVQAVYSGGAYIEGAGVVVHSGVGDLSLGVCGPEPDQLSAGLLNDTTMFLDKGGLPNRLCGNVSLLAWEKLCTNAAINAVTAILRIKNGGLLNSTAAMDLMKGVCSEAHSVGVEVLRSVSSQEDWESFHRQGWEACYERALTVAERTRPNTSSMLSDILKSKQTEVEFINGVIVKEGKKYGIETPYNQVLLSMVRALQDTSASRV